MIHLCARGRADRFSAPSPFALGLPAEAVTLVLSLVIGMRTVVIDHVAVGERTVVAAGAAVVADAAAGVRVQAVPARPHPAPPA